MPKYFLRTRSGKEVEITEDHYKRKVEGRKRHTDFNDVFPNVAVNQHAVEMYWAEDLEDAEEEGRFIHPPQTEENSETLEETLETPETGPEEDSLAMTREEFTQRAEALDCVNAGRVMHQKLAELMGYSPATIRLYVKEGPSRYSQPFIAKLREMTPDIAIEE